MSPTPGKNSPKQNKPNRRREGREAALQLLFSLESQPDLLESGLDEFWAMRVGDKEVRKHTESLVRGVTEHKKVIDERIASTVENFSLERLAAVDRNILRVALFEMFHDIKVPPVVSLNEALEIAKRFGSEDSAKFINGVLDKLMKTLDRKLR